MRMILLQSLMSIQAGDIAFLLLIVLLKKDLYSLDYNATITSAFPNPVLSFILIGFR